MNEGSILQVDDMSIGTFITIRNGYIMDDGNKSCYFDGRPFVIVSIILPYIIVKFPIIGSSNDVGARIFDIRRGKFIALPDAYVKNFDPVFFLQKDSLITDNQVAIKE